MPDSPPDFDAIIKALGNAIRSQVLIQTSGVFGINVDKTHIFFNPGDYFVIDFIPLAQAVMKVINERK